MASTRSKGRRPRGPRRSSGSAQPEAPGGRFLSQSHKRLLQIGSAAAAIGSVLALVFTVGDRASGLLKGNDGGPKVSVADVELEPMSLQQYLVTKERKKPPFSQYNEKELQGDVLVVTFHAEYSESAAGARFPYWLTLLGRKGTVAEPPLERVAILKKADDACDCHDIFALPPRGREYRAQVQIMDAEAPPNSQPLAEAKSDWYRVPRL